MDEMIIKPHALGAFIGDFVGSAYEFDNTNNFNFELITKDSYNTDDSIMTLAVYDICESGDFSSKHIIDTFRKWGKRYPRAGYGNRFMDWLLWDQTYSFNDSFGNGSAMRISPVAYFATSQEDLVKKVIAITEVSHNHPEGIKGAIVTATCIYMALHGATKELIKAYASSQYSLYESRESLVLSNEGHGEEICQVSVPQALSAFFLTDNFMDCLRLIVSAGGDCDTTAAIVCPIAEAYYGGVPADLAKAATEQIETYPEAKKIFAFMHE